MSPGYPAFFVGLEKCICVYQDQAVAASHENKCTIATTTDRDATSKLCSKSNRCNSAAKSRRNLTEVHCNFIFLLFCI